MTFTTAVKGKVSINNSGSGIGNFSSSGTDDVSTFAIITIYVFASSGGTLSAEFSNDDTNFDVSEEFTLPMSTGVSFQLNVKGRYFRLNQSGGVGTFRIQTMFHPSNLKIPKNRTSIDHYCMKAVRAIVTVNPVVISGFDSDQIGSGGGGSLSPDTQNSILIENTSGRVMTIHNIVLTDTDNVTEFYCYKNVIPTIDAPVYSGTNNTGGVRYLTDANSLDIDGTSADLVFRQKVSGTGVTANGDNLMLNGYKITLNPGDNLYGNHVNAAAQIIDIMVWFSLE